MTSEIWIVDDDTSISWVIDKALTKQGFATKAFNNAEAVLSALDQQRPDLIISDIHMPGMDGFSLVEQVANQFDDAIPVIIMTAFGDLDSAVTAFKTGVYEYLTKPFDTDELVALVAKAVQVNKVEEKPAAIESSNARFLGDSVVMQEVFRVIGRVARTDMGVLIRGESGSGKELVARALHENSLRSALPFVAINTAAIPAELLESELFGHEKGAFTGAHARHIGRFEQADGATLFLDEIGDMPAGLQTRLLRVLSEGKFFRVGGRQEISVNVRIIAATNQNLESMVETGGFRNDLFHRLNVMSIEVPPLRERSDDIPILVESFINEFAQNGSVSPKLVSDDALQILVEYGWPGNVRELQNVIQQMMVLSPGSVITAADIPVTIANQSNSAQLDSDRDGWKTDLKGEVARKLRLGESNVAKSIVEDTETILIQSALEHTEGHRQRAAKRLGWGRNTLARKIDQLLKNQ